MKLPITAVVVTYNEDAYLKQCLNSISFCNEILVFDLGSTDNSVAIAKECGAIVIPHEQVPIVEVLHAKMSEYLSHDWVLLTDPDEVASDHLIECILRNFERWAQSEEIGAVRFPWRTYVGNYMLKGTIKGAHCKKTYLLNKNRFLFTPDIHLGRKLKSGFKFHIVKDANYFIHHYWIVSLNELIVKLRRYLKHEGTSRFNAGDVPTIPHVVFAPLVIFYRSFVSYKGYQDKLIGLKLSVIWAWYQTASRWRAFRYAKKNSGR